MISVTTSIVGYRIAAQLLKGALQDCVFCCSSREGLRYALHGVAIECADGEATFVASDGKRMVIRAGCHIATMENAETPSATHVIPAKDCRKLAAAIGVKSKGMVDVTISGPTIAFRWEHAKKGSMEYACQLIEGRFPQWRLVVPNLDDAVATISADASDWQDWYEKASTIGVDLFESDGKPTLAQHRVSVPRFREMVHSGVLPNEPVTLDPAYVTEFVSGLHGRQKVTMSIVNAESAVRFDSALLTYVVMPLWK